MDKEHKKYRERTTRRTVLAAGAGVSGALLAACAAPGGAPPQGVGSNPLRITLTTDEVSPGWLEVYDVYKAEFAKKHPNVTVEHEYVQVGSGSGGAYTEKIVAQLAAGTPPEIIGNWSYWPHTDGLVDLTADAPRAGWKKADLVYNPFTQELNGRLYMLSMNHTLSGWIYNKSLFVENALKEPDESWTLDDVTAAAQKITRSDKSRYGLFIRNGDGNSWQELAWGAGAGHITGTTAQYFDPAKKKWRLNEGSAPAAFEWFIDNMHRRQIAPTAADVTEYQIQFQRGNVGMQPALLTGLGNMANTIKDNFQWGVMPVPKDPAGKKRAYYVNSEGWTIAKASRQRGTFDAALAYAVSYYSDAVQQAIAQRGVTLPIAKRWIDSKEYLQAPPLNKTILVRMINDKEIVVGDTQYQLPERADSWRALKVEVDKAYAGQAQARAALAAGHAEADRVLSAYGAR